MIMAARSVRTNGWPFTEGRPSFMYMDTLCPFGHEMSKRKTYKIFLSLEDRIDADLEFDKDPGRRHRLARFAVTYSARIGGRWREVVPYDNFHGYLHRQRFWRTREPEPLSTLERLPILDLLNVCRQDLARHWRRYRSLMESMLKEE